MKKFFIPGSKSYTNRALLLAALCETPVTLHGALDCEDTQAMRECLKILGGHAPTTLSPPYKTTLNSPCKTFFARDSGTTLRFLLPLLSLIPGEKILTGSEALNKRPIGPLVDALKQLGANIEYLGEPGFPPLKIFAPNSCIEKLDGWRGERGPRPRAACEHGGVLQRQDPSSKIVQLDASISSQFLSALLMTAPLLKNGLTIELTGKLSSKSYVYMTIAMMEEWGVSVKQNERSQKIRLAEDRMPSFSIRDEAEERTGTRIHSVLADDFGQSDCEEVNLSFEVPKNQIYKKDTYTIEGDYSSAAYFLGAAALQGSTLFLENLNPHSLQGDKILLSLLRDMGNEIEQKETGVKIHGKGVKALECNMENCPDQIQTLAVLAAFAEGKTIIHGIHTLRFKETDRIFALQTELKKMGVETEATENTLIIQGGNPRPAKIKTYGDHRMAMAFAIASVVLEGMEIENPEVVNKSFPAFWSLFESLRQQ